MQRGLLIAVRNQAPQMALRPPRLRKLFCLVIALRQRLPSDGDEHSCTVTATFQPIAAASPKTAAAAIVDSCAVSETLAVHAGDVAPFARLQERLRALADAASSIARVGLG
jgi:hypothetical protein